MGKYLDPKADVTFKKIFGQLMREITEQTRGCEQHPCCLKTQILSLRV